FARDWSSDVCSSDLPGLTRGFFHCRNHQCHTFCPSHRLIRLKRTVRITFYPAFSYCLPDDRFCPMPIDVAVWFLWFSLFGCVNHLFQREISSRTTCRIPTTMPIYVLEVWQDFFQVSNQPHTSLELCLWHLG